MTHELKVSGGFVLASLTAQSINVAIAILTGLCGLIVILPKTIETLRRTKWRTLFSRDKSKP